ncbi:MAG: galactose mutarotase [Candidatus Aenigmarchaeota archaeon]|nr:galactose mutarotase [Candidatus Aenigmarchaeota archaeon]
MDVEKSVYGILEDGQPVHIFKITTDSGMVAEVLTYGATIASLKVPDREGKLRDVVLGYDDLNGYLHNHGHIGTIAGRYANRIGKARFSIDGEEFRLKANNGENNLHGGPGGLDKAIWKAREFMEKDRAGVILSYLSKDGEAGFPGNLETEIVYSFSNNGEWIIEYLAKTDKPTHVNLTQHAYFNLNGGKRDILDEILQIDAKTTTEVNSQLIPTGVLKDISDGSSDFSKPKSIGQDILRTGGYDLNYVPEKGPGLSKVASAFDKESGIKMDVLTTEPGLQLYTANHFNGFTGKGGTRYTKHYGVCFETQHFPDSPNRPEFPSTLLRPGQEYRSKTVYKFSVQ